MQEVAKAELMSAVKAESDSCDKFIDKLQFQMKAVMAADRALQAEMKTLEHVKSRVAQLAEEMASEVDALAKVQASVDQSMLRMQKMRGEASLKAEPQLPLGSTSAVRRADLKVASDKVEQANLNHAAKAYLTRLNNQQVNILGAIRKLGKGWVSTEAVANSAGVSQDAAFGLLEYLHCSGLLNVAPGRSSHVWRLTEKGQQLSEVNAA